MAGAFLDSITSLLVPLRLLCLAPGWISAPTCSAAVGMGMNEHHVRPRFVPRRLHRPIYAKLVDATTSAALP